MLKVQEIRELIKLIDDSSIDEFTYETNGTKVSMKKSLEASGNPTTIYKTQPVKDEALKEVEVKRSENIDEKDNSADNEVQPEETADYDYEIISPMVGTFYGAPNPESDPYVKTGDSVNKETVVCIVEAMKLFNEIEAEATGEIVEILVEDGELVEYGQPLFRVKTK